MQGSFLVASTQTEHMETGLKVVNMYNKYYKILCAL